MKVFFCLFLHLRATVELSEVSPQIELSIRAAECLEVLALVGLINYKYLPIQLRVLFHNLAAVTVRGVFLILRSRASVPGRHKDGMGQINPAALPKAAVL